MKLTPNSRGKRFEGKVIALLTELAADNPGFVEVRVQPEIRLFNGQIKRPDVELIYRLEQEHHELIECQSRNRSSAEIADKIRSVKTFSSRNRFVFVFEDFSKLGEKHRLALESDGVNCLSMDVFKQKITQLDMILTTLRSTGLQAHRRRLAAAGQEMFHRTPQTMGWEELMELLRQDSSEKPVFGYKPYFGAS